MRSDHWVRVAIHESESGNEETDAGSQGRGFFSESDGDYPTPRKVMPCAACGKEMARYRCGHCRLVRYCNRQCQRNHWISGHARECAEGAAFVWGDFDVFAQILSCLPARGASQAMAVCSMWQRWGPKLLRAARWRGHPGARRLRSKPHGSPSWRGLHVAENFLLSEDFQDRTRWTYVVNADAEGVPDSLDGHFGMIALPGEENMGGPLIPAALVHKLPGLCRPRKLRLRLRCAPLEPYGRCSTYVVVGGSDASSIIAANRSSHLNSPLATAFVSWSPGRRRGVGRRVVGFLNHGSTMPIVDETRCDDETELILRFSWRKSTKQVEIDMQVGTFGRICTSADAGEGIRTLALGIGPGSKTNFHELHLM